MKFREVLLGALLGALTGLPLMALSYLAQQVANLPFLPFLQFEWLARTLPGAAITAGIDAMVGAIVALGLGPIDVVAKTVEQLAGMLLVVVQAAIIGALMAWILHRRNWSGRTVGAVFGIVAAIGFLAMELTVGPSAGNLQWILLWLALLVLAGALCWVSCLTAATSRALSGRGQRPPRAVRAARPFSCGSAASRLHWPWRPGAWDGFWRQWPRIAAPGSPSRLWAAPRLPGLRRRRPDRSCCLRPARRHPCRPGVSSRRPAPGQR